MSIPTPSQLPQPPNEALSDETISINSIYEPSTLTPTTPPSSIYNLQLLHPHDSIVLRLDFPSDYPNAPPIVLGTESVGPDVPKGLGPKILGIVRRVLERVYEPGQPCLFDLLPEVQIALTEGEENGLIQLHDAPSPSKPTPKHQQPQEEPHDLGPPPPWTLAPPLHEKKSLFLARSAPVSSVPQAQTYIQHLLATDKKVAKATHNITAWRIRGENGTVAQDFDDDGETAAGGRVLHLMQVMEVWDVVVVVSRWYGGILLGPDRFRLINSAAREALVLGGFGGEEGGKEGGRRKK
ncbi:UPF0029-domain-containing protein [Sporormia fimetaria CBS 119925]|uniref:UPF0029-domain-containing protein n=1 Tax=Sporormia fimetaria CBS 119925 TaxID=1340428 RepID=A0A6A6V840_9PLEO|nr:UPF0029-domain-containing protein [Sporormia fimetaria CBS 119925]